LGRQGAGLLATHSFGRGASSRPQPLRPLHHTRNADPKRRGNGPAVSACHNRRNNTLAKIKGNKVASSMLTSNPASILNQNPLDLGIPNRFKPDESGSKHQFKMLAALPGARSTNRPTRYKVDPVLTTIAVPWIADDMEGNVVPVRRI
jgi:hypothetical protein